MHNSPKDIETDLSAHNQEKPKINSFKLYTVLLKTRSSAWRLQFTVDNCFLENNPVKDREKWMQKQVASWQAVTRLEPGNGREGNRDKKFL